MFPMIFEFPRPVVVKIVGFPFIIQLSPGQYSETLNKIVLPDYVSLRGEDNYNSVITQNTGKILKLQRNKTNNDSHNQI